MKAKILIFILIFSIFVHWIAYAVENPIDDIIKENSIEGKKFEEDKQSIYDDASIKSIKNSIFNYCKMENKELKVADDLQLGNPFRVINDYNLSDIVGVWVEGKKLSDVFEKQPYNWVIPIMYNSKLSNPEEYKIITSCRLFKKDNENSWDISSIGGREFSSQEMAFCSDSNTLSDYLKKNGIIKGSYFAIFEIYWIHAFFVYIQSGNQEFFIPLKGDDDNSLGLQEMKIYKRDDEVITALSLRLKAEVDMVNRPMGYIDYNIPYVFIDKKHIDFDVDPVIENDRTLVPLRKITELLNAQVDWNEETKTVILTKDSNKVKLTIGDTNAYKNDTQITLDTAAEVINNRTLAPIRFISEALGATVDYDESANIVIINSKK